MDLKAKQALAIDRMADALAKHEVCPLIVDAVRMLAGRAATEAILGTVK